MTINEIASFNAKISNISDEIIFEHINELEYSISQKNKDLRELEQIRNMLILVFDFRKGKIGNF